MTFEAPSWLIPALAGREFLHYSKMMGGFMAFLTFVGPVPT
ncbi:hypothetical protein [Rhizobium cremeum]